MENILTLTLEQKRLIQTSFAKITMRSGTFCELFYNQLFWADQSLLPLVKGTKNETHRWLMQTLSTYVALLDKPEALQEAVQQLSKAAAAAGYKKRHYAAFGKALMEALERVLGKGLTDEVRDAWLRLYNNVSAVALQAGYDHV